MNSLLHIDKIPVADYYSVGAADRLDFPFIEAGRSQSRRWRIHKHQPYLIYPEEFAERCRRSDFIPHAHDPFVKLQALRHCTANASHVTHEYLVEPVDIAVSSRGEVPPFLVDSPYPIINNQLGATLASKRFAGLKFGTVELDPEWSYSITDETLTFLSGEHPLPRLRRVLGAESDNACPFCGEGPLYCEECGHLSVRCRHCDNTTIQGIVFDPSDELEDRRVSTHELFPDYLPENRVGYALDLRRWDQPWDFSGIGTYSRKMFEALIEAGAYPMVVTPLLCVYDGDIVGYRREDAIDLVDFYHSEDGAPNWD